MHWNIEILSGKLREPLFNIKQLFWDILSAWNYRLNLLTKYANLNVHIDVRLSKHKKKNYNKKHDIYIKTPYLTVQS